MLTPQEVRRFDQIAIQKFGIPGVVLMENAGVGCFRELIEETESLQLAKTAIILCGPGNNGGDGFVIARHLWNCGWKVRVLFCCDPQKISGDAAMMLRPLLRLPMELIQLPSTDDAQVVSDLVSTIRGEPVAWIIDAMLGTGAVGAPRGSVRRAIQVANQLRVRRMAIDIPSGLNAETGEQYDIVFNADVTCTFVDQKSGFAHPDAKSHLGRVSVIPIGIDARAIQV